MASSNSKRIRRRPRALKLMRDVWELCLPEPPTHGATHRLSNTETAVTSEPAHHSEASMATPATWCWHPKYLADAPRKHAWQPINGLTTREWVETST